MTVFASFLALPRWVHIALAVVALLAIGFTVHRCSVSSAVKADRAAAEAEVARKALDAERTANRADAARQAAIQANDASTRKAIDDAVAKDSEGAKAPAGPAAQAAARQLRRRANDAHD